MFVYLVLFCLCGAPKKMKSIALIFACILAVNAIDYSNVRPIEDLLLKYPREYPSVSAMYGGRSSTGRIVGGEEAIPGNFPHQAALFIETKDGTFFCGGSILNKDYVLTAAHCVDKAIEVEVILGAHNVRELESTQRRIIVPKANIKVHERWISLLIRNDIAVMQLTESVNFTERIQPISLPRQKDRDNSFVDDPCTTSGWGKDKDCK